MESKYSAHIYWDSNDGDFIARCTEFPHLSGLGKTKKEALKSLEDAIEMAVEMLKEDGAVVPPSMNCPEYSGNIRLRMPKSLHRTLSEKAETEGVSLNTYMLSLLSRNSAGETHLHLNSIRIKTEDSTIPSLFTNSEVSESPANFRVAS